MKIRPTKIDRLRGKVEALGFTVALCFVSATSAAELKPGPVEGNTVYLENARSYPFCEFEVVMGTPPALGVEIYNTSGQEKCLPAQFEPIDAKALAQELGAEAVVKNPTRYWLMDQLWSYGAGEVHDFGGIKATWMGHIDLKAGALGEKGKPFAPYHESTVTRNSKYLWSKGTEVYLLRTPDGHASVMQAFTDLVDKTLTEADLPKLGSKLNLPSGWKFETKTLEQDLTLSPPKSTGYLAHAVSDEFQNIYAGCGFDDACNYLP
jgi:hypothetical protein